MIVANINHFSYSPQECVLKEVSLNINTGERVVITGLSGCGKTTLLRLLAGLLPRANTSNLFEGDIQIMSLTPAEFRNGGRLAFMFQEPILFPHMTVIQNVSWPLMVTKAPVAWTAEQVLDRVGLGRELLTYPEELSGGMKARVALARSIITQPSVLLLDEPFSGLDIGWRHTLYEHLVALCSDIRCTVCMVTHDIRESVRTADRIVVMAKGTLRHEFQINDRSEEGISLFEDLLEQHLLIEHNAERSLTHFKSR